MQFDLNLICMLHVTSHIRIGVHTRAIELVSEQQGVTWVSRLGGVN